MGMKMVFRWYTKANGIDLGYIRQIPGVTGIAGELPEEVGKIWRLEDILALKRQVEEHGLEMEVIESVKVHEDIKLGRKSRDLYIYNYIETIRNLGKAGIKVVCYDFMPVFDWMRTETERRLPDGSTVLAYDHEVIKRTDPLDGDFALCDWEMVYSREELRELISNKNYFGVEELIQEQHLAPELADVFMQMPQLFGGTEILEKAKTMTNNEKALASVERLEEIYRILEMYGCAQYITFDLGMLSKYKYYTGIIMQAYTYGTGQPLVKGGRYNNLLAHFGKPCSSVGFTLVMEHLMNALSRQGIEVPLTWKTQEIYYDEKNRQEAIEQAMAMRREGRHVVLKRKEVCP